MNWSRQVSVFTNCFIFSFVVKRFVRFHFNFNCKHRFNSIYFHESRSDIEFNKTSTGNGILFHEYTSRLRSLASHPFVLVKPLVRVLLAVYYSFAGRDSRIFHELLPIKWRSAPDESWMLSKSPFNAIGHRYNLFERENGGKGERRTKKSKCRIRFAFRQGEVVKRGPGIRGVVVKILFTILGDDFDGP